MLNPAPKLPLTAPRAPSSHREEEAVSLLRESGRALGGLQVSEAGIGTLNLALDKAEDEQALGALEQHGRCVLVVQRQLQVKTNEFEMLRGQHRALQAEIDEQRAKMERLREEEAAVQRIAADANLPPEKLVPALDWIKRVGWSTTFVLIVLWPALSTPAGVFSNAVSAVSARQPSSLASSLAQSAISRRWCAAMPHWSASSGPCTRKAERKSRSGGGLRLMECRRAISSSACRESLRNLSLGQGVR